MNIQIIKDQLIKYEGKSSTLYKCPAGKWTIGVGRNLEDNPLTESEMMYLLDNDIFRTANELSDAFYWFNAMDDVRGSVIMNMAFNLGISRFSGFRKMIRCIVNDDWNGAAREMIDSKWAGQVGNRAYELADKMRDGI